MSATLFTSSKYSATDAAGLPLAFGLVYTHAAGSLTPQATYTSQSGVSPNTNPIVLDASGRANIWLGPYSYRFIVKNAAGVLMPDGDIDNITNPTASVQLTQPTTDLMIGDGVTTVYTLSANPGNVNNVFFSLGGAIQVPGVDYTISGVVITCISPPPNLVAGFFNYTVALPVATLDSASAAYRAAGGGATVRDVQSKLREKSSVKDFGAIGNGIADDTAAIQAAIIASAQVYFPNGTYKISAKLILRTDSQLIGQTERQTFIYGTHAGIIFEFPYLSFDAHVERLYFYGTGCTAIAVATTAGPFQYYLPRARIKCCHFGFDLAYGINADLINSHIDECSFGYTGPAGANSPWVGTMVAINAVFNGTNYVNINSVNRCIFKIGTATQAGINLVSGTLFHFNYCDFEAGGKVLSASNLSGLSFTGCWFENSTTSTGVIALNGGQYLGHVVFDRCWIACGAEAAYFFTYASGWLTNAVTFRNCNIGLGAATHLLYDVTTTSYSITGDSRVVWDSNSLTGGPATDQFQTAADFGGQASSKAWAIVNTAGIGTLVASSDAGATVTRNSVGDVYLNFSRPMGTAIAKICPIAIGQTTYACAFSAASVSNVRIQTFARIGGAATDDIVQVVVFGK